jgi:hypothetical protein
MPDVPMREQVIRQMANPALLVPANLRRIANSATVQMPMSAAGTWPLICAMLCGIRLRSGP